MSPTNISPPPELLVSPETLLTDTFVQSAKDLLAQHGYVLLCGLDDMSPEQMKCFCEKLAPKIFMIPFNDDASAELTPEKVPACIQHVPEVRVLGTGPYGNALLADVGIEWHQDGGGTGLFLTLLHCKEPCEGANTLFADGEILFNRLSCEQQTLARSLVAVYSNKYTAGGPTALDAAYGLRMSPCGTQRIHPSSRRKQNWKLGQFEKPIIEKSRDGCERFLAGAKGLEYIVGYDEDESRRLLSLLMQSALCPTTTTVQQNDQTKEITTFAKEAVYVHKWRSGQAILWDNSRMLHSTTPLSEYVGDRRLMWQIIFKILE